VWASGVAGSPEWHAGRVILPKVRDPRLVTSAVAGTLTDTDHRLLALWAAECADHVLRFFEDAQPSDGRPRDAVGAARAWARGEMRMMDARSCGGHAMGAARPRLGASRYAAYAAVTLLVLATCLSMISVPPPMRSGRREQHVRRVQALGALSVTGSAPDFPSRFGRSSLRTRLGAT
jgi:hypothetical protein